MGGVGLACTDLLSPHGLLKECDTTRWLAMTNEQDRPLGMQLYGSDPAILAEGARWCADHGATVVDINMGCPVDKVCKNDGGSKLMCIPDAAVRIAQAVRSALPDAVPLTAKMRLGWTQEDAEQNNAGQLACRLIDVGVSAITVHGRTTEQRFKGSCDLQGIKRVVEMVAAHTGRYTGETTGGIPVIGNGDVGSADDVVTMMQVTGCSGVMIGRGAFARPWIFRDAWVLQTTGHMPEPMSESDKIDFVRDYFLRMCEVNTERQRMHKIRQKIARLGKNINNSHSLPLKQGIREARNSQEVLDVIANWKKRVIELQDESAEQREEALAASVLYRRGGAGEPIKDG